MGFEDIETEVILTLCCHFDMRCAPPSHTHREKEQLCVRVNKIWKLL